MPLVRPFRGLGYALERFASRHLPERIRLPEEPDVEPGAGRRVADLTDVVCPPYDVISPDQQAALLARDERNAVRLELSADPDPHAVAAATLAAWRADGTLTMRGEPSVYYYAHGTATSPDDPVVQGVLARVLLEPFGAGVRAHEHTMPGPKADRLALLRATRTQLSPILALYFDRSERYRHVMSRSWSDEWRARDGDGLLHALAAVEPDDRLLGYLDRQRLIIADGHHRYETALAYQAEVRANPPWADAPEGSLAADWVMVVLVNAELEELEILPTHRLLMDQADGAALGAFAMDSGPMWTSARMDAAELPAALEQADERMPAFGLVLPRDAYLLTGDRDLVADRMGRERSSTAVRRLDLTVLHAAILEDRVGIDARALEAGDRVTYTRDESAARAAVAGGAASAAILVRPTRLEELAAVASAWDFMPQKSTYFYPKLLTGLVFNSLED
jgi:uncharacterized protein (DUF1015 family)